MQSSQQRQQFNSSKRDFFESSTLSKGFFHDNEEEYEPDTYQQVRKEMKAMNVSDDITGFNQQTSVSQVYTSRRKKQSTSTTPKKQQNTPPQDKLVTNTTSRGQRKTYKKRSTKQMSNQVEKLDDDQLIIHDQIMFSKSVSLPLQQSKKQQGKLQTKQQALFQFDNNNDEEDDEEQQRDNKNDVKDEDINDALNKQNQQNINNNNVGEIKKKSRFEIVFQPSQLGQNNSSSDSQQQQQQQPLPKDSIQQQNNNTRINKPHLPSNLNQLINNQPQSIKSKTGPITPQHMIKVLTYPIAKNILMKTNIKRVSGFFNIYPQYHVFFQADKTHLMSAKRVSKTPYSTFVISMNQNNFEENSSYYLGKAKGSVMGDQLDIFGPGFSPSVAFDKKVKPRQFIASIVYQTRILNSGQPRDFSVYIKKPQIDYYQHFPQIKMYGDEISLNLLYQNPHNRDKIILLKNKKPQYIKQIQSYSLNFNGRAGVASVKNFILQKISKSSEQINQTDNNLPIWPMLFGKVNENIFNMDIGLPLSPLIAFGVALSSFDEKFFCE